MIEAPLTFSAGRCQSFPALPGSFLAQASCLIFLNTFDVIFRNLAATLARAAGLFVPELCAADEQYLI